MEGLPGRGISSMPFPPPRQHEHERRCKPFTHPFIPTRRKLNVDYNVQMIFGELVGLKLPDICLAGEEKKMKKPHPGNFSRPGIEPDRRTCYHLLHSGGHDIFILIKFYLLCPVSGT